MYVSGVRLVVCVLVFIDFMAGMYGIVDWLEVESGCMSKWTFFRPFRYRNKTNITILFAKMGEGP